MGASKAEMAVAHLLLAISRDGRLAYLLGYGTASFELLTEAHAEAYGLNVEKYREDFWAQCSPTYVSPKGSAR